MKIQRNVICTFCSRQVSSADIHQQNSNCASELERNPFKLSLIDKIKTINSGNWSSVLAYYYMLDGNPSETTLLLYCGWKQIHLVSWEKMSHERENVTKHDLTYGWKKMVIGAICEYDTLHSGNFVLRPCFLCLHAGVKVGRNDHHLRLMGSAPAHRHIGYTYGKPQMPNNTSFSHNLQFKKRLLRCFSSQKFAAL